jgi:hypothetical protein
MIHCTIRGSRQLHGVSKRVPPLQLKAPIPGRPICLPTFLLLLPPQLLLLVH